MGGCAKGIWGQVRLCLTEGGFSRHTPLKVSTPAELDPMTVACWTFTVGAAPDTDEEVVQTETVEEERLELLLNVDVWVVVGVVVVLGVLDEATRMEDVVEVLRVEEEVCGFGAAAAQHASKRSTSEDRATGAMMCFLQMMDVGVRRRQDHSTSYTLGEPWSATSAGLQKAACSAAERPDYAAGRVFPCWRIHTHTHDILRGAPPLASPRISGPRATQT